MNNEKKPVDIFTLFGGTPNKVKEPNKEQPTPPRTSEQELQEWLSVDNDMLFSEEW